MVGPSGGVEAGVGELFAEEFQRYAVLQRDGDGEGEAVHQAGDGRAFFGHLDEDLAGLSIRIQAYYDVAFVASYVELVGYRHAFFFQLVTQRARWGVQIVVKVSLDGRDARRSTTQGGLAAGG